VRELIALDPMESELAAAGALADEYLVPNRKYFPSFH
jgi:hypothetical protein